MNTTPQVMSSRFALFVASIAYAFAVGFCLKNYAAVEWGEYGYSFGQIAPFEWVLIASGLWLWSLFVPMVIESPSDLTLILVYCAICIPGLIVPLGLESVDESSFFWVSVALIAAFSGCCWLVRSLSPMREMQPRSPTRWFAPILLVSWLICVVVLVYEYRSVMTFVSLEAIYDQRAAGSATSRAIGYAQTYLGYVLSPGLLALGLVRRSFVLAALGVAGGLVLYSITAEKNAFAFLIIGLAYVLRHDAHLFRSAATLLALLAAVLIAAVYHSQESLIAGFFAWYIGVRSLLTPGLFIAQYYEFFSERGFTLWSHVTGLSLVVAKPPGLADERWPSLGHMVGEQFVGKLDLNANANFVASDGIAACGALGVLLVFIALAIYLVLLDRACVGIDRRLALLVTLPMALTLTNVSYFTVLLSFGGLFWLLAFNVFFRRSTGPTPSGRAPSHVWKPGGPGESGRGVASPLSYGQGMRQ